MGIDLSNFTSPIYSYAHHSLRMPSHFQSLHLCSHWAVQLAVLPTHLYLQLSLRSSDYYFKCPSFREPFKTCFPPSLQTEFGSPPLNVSQLFLLEFLYSALLLKSLLNIPWGYSSVVEYLHKNNCLPNKTIKFSKIGTRNLPF